MEVMDFMLGVTAQSLAREEQNLNIRRKPTYSEDVHCF